MKPRNITLVALSLLVGLFAAMNWETFNRATALNFGVARMDVPLGLLMLGIVAALTAVYIVLLARIEASALLESRRVGKELERARKLAESGEESRFQALQRTLEIEFEQLHDKIDLFVQEDAGGRSVRLASTESSDR